MRTRWLLHTRIAVNHGSYAANGASKTKNGREGGKMYVVKENSPNGECVTRSITDRFIYVMLMIDLFTLCWWSIYLRYVDDLFIYVMLMIGLFTLCWWSLYLRYVDDRLIYAILMATKPTCWWSWASGNVRISENILRNFYNPVARQQPS